jgi:hypothetical protein
MSCRLAIWLTVFAAIDGMDFDFVVLQERSQKPCEDAVAYP